MVMCFYKSEACEPGKYMNINQSEKQFLRGMGNKQPSWSLKVDSTLSKSKGQEHRALQLPEPFGTW
jgi:hypothetical protein